MFEEDLRGFYSIVVFQILQGRLSRLFNGLNTDPHYKRSLGPGKAASHFLVDTEL